MKSILATVVALGLVIAADVSVTRAVAGCACGLVSASDINVRLRKINVPQNGQMRVASYDRYDVIGVFSKGKFVDVQLKDPRTGKTFTGKDLKINAGCLTKTFDLPIIGKKTLKICVTIEIT